MEQAFLREVQALSGKRLAVRNVWIWVLSLFWCSSLSYPRPSSSYSLGGLSIWGFCFFFRLSLPCVITEKHSNPQSGLNRQEHPEIVLNEGTPNPKMIIWTKPNLLRSFCYLYSTTSSLAQPLPLLFLLPHLFSSYCPTRAPCLVPS